MQIYDQFTNNFPEANEQAKFLEIKRPYFN